MVALTADNGGDVNDYRGGDRPKPGIYHVVVKSAEETVSKQKGTQGYKVEFEVLAGTVPGQEGKELDETFWVTEKAVGRLIALALASGVMKPGDSADSDVLLETPGHQLVIEVEEQDYEDKGGNAKKTVGVAFGGLWPVGHEDVKHVPLNADALKLAGITVPAGGGASGEKQEAKTAGKRKAKVADAAAEKPAEKEEKAADDWSDVLN